MELQPATCNLQYAKKSKQLDSFNADVLIIQECESLPSDYKPGYQLFWVGNNDKKGLAVLVRGANSFIVKMKQTTLHISYLFKPISDF